MIHVHRGKGAKDRYVPLPDETVQLLRRYWLTHRNPVLVFPAVGRGHQQASTSAQGMAISSVQGAFREARFAAGIGKRHVSVHTCATVMLPTGFHQVGGKAVICSGGLPKKSAGIRTARV